MKEATVTMEEATATTKEATATVNKTAETEFVGHFCYVIDLGGVCGACLQ